MRRYIGDEMKEVETGGESRRSLGRAKHRREDNIRNKINFKGTM
jgi:hypothetical protein